jgi:putative FmdB family regulatory protein
MPLYEYICRDCNEGFEALVPASQRDDAAEGCPQCGSERIARRISLIGGHISRSAARDGGSSEPFSCGAPGGCCGGGCQMD